MALRTCAVRRIRLGETSDQSRTALTPGPDQQLAALRADGQLPRADGGGDLSVHHTDHVAVAQLAGQPSPVDHRERPRVHADTCAPPGRDGDGALVRTDVAGASHGGAGTGNCQPGIPEGGRATRSASEGAGAGAIFGCCGTR